MYNTITEFKIGEWYEVGNPAERYINIVKVNKVITNERIEIESGSYNTKNASGNSSGWRTDGGFISGINYNRRLTLEEVQKYLPEEHEDKYITYDIY